MTPTVSLCMIVLDGEATLRRALDSVRGAVDEIVLAVDSRTTDSTREIGAAHGARVADFTWADDFSAARRESFRHAPTDWLLVFDADEWLEDGSAALVRGDVAAAGPSVAGYLVTKVTAHNLFGRVAQRRERLVHLFRRQPGAEPWGAATDEVGPVIARLGLGSLEPSRVVIRHEHMLTREQWQAKAERNLRLARRQLEAEPEHGYLWYSVATILQVQRGTDAAIEAYRQALRHVGRFDDYAARAWCELGKLLYERGDSREGVACLRRAATSDATLPDPHAMLGDIALIERRWADAEGHFRAAAYRAKADHPTMPAWQPTLGLRAARQRLSHQAYRAMVACRMAEGSQGAV